MSDHGKKAVKALAKAGANAVAPGSGIVVEVASAVAGEWLPKISANMAIDEAIRLSEEEESTRALARDEFYAILRESEEHMAAHAAKWKELPEEERPTASNVAAVVLRLAEAHRRTADRKKVDLLRLALVNVLDPDLYRSGWIEELLGLVEQLTYPDVVVLRELEQSDAPKYSAIGDVFGDYAAKKLHELGLARATKHNSYGHPRDFMVSELGRLMCRLLREKKLTLDSEEASE